MVPRGWVRSAGGTSSIQGASPVLYGLHASSDAATGNGLSTFLGSSAMDQFDSIVLDFLVLCFLLCCWQLRACVGVCSLCTCVVGGGSLLLSFCFCFDPGLGYGASKFLCAEGSGGWFASPY